MLVKYQVVDYNRSEKLNELGVNGLSIFYWFRLPGCDPEVYGLLKKHDAPDVELWYGYPLEINQIRNRFTIRAYTLSELGLMIGKGTFLSERYNEHLQACMNRGQSISVCFDPSDVADFLIRMIEADEANNKAHDILDGINERLSLSSHTTKKQE